MIVLGLRHRDIFFVRFLETKIELKGGVLTGTRTIDYSSISIIDLENSTPMIFYNKKQKKKRAIIPMDILDTNDRKEVLNLLHKTKEAVRDVFLK